MKTTESQVKWSYLWLATGSAIMYFSNWNWAFPAATWLFAVFLLRFSRSRKIITGQVILCLVIIIVGIASMWRLLSIEAIPPPFRIVSGIVVGILSFLPFFVDRLLKSKLQGEISTLVFPCSWVALEYLKSSGNGSWGALAYTQYGNLPLMQIVSITGIWGLSFLITWFAAIVNFSWEQKFAWRKIRKITILYGLIFTIVFLYGYIRLASPEESADRVTIASVTNPRDFFSRFYEADWTDRESAHKSMQNDVNYLFEATRNSALAGSKIVLWQEYAVSVMQEDEQEFIDKARKLAREEQIYLVMGIGLFPLNYPDQLWQNKLIWIDPSGKVIGEYLKLKPAPPLEPIVPGEGGILISETAYGRIASVICADLDYPSLIREAGGGSAKILLIAAQSWKAVDPLHTHMGVFRAVENGISLVMGTGGGLSVAVDPYGRVLTSSDYFKSSENQMVTDLPAYNIVTPYSRIGDAFAWLCIACFVAFNIWGHFIRRKQG